MTLDEPFKGYEAFHKRCKELTGDDWCPYPSLEFIAAVAAANDDVARELIAKRRTLLFPHFLAGEPMATEISKIMGSTWDTESEEIMKRIHPGKLRRQMQDFFQAINNTQQTRQTWREIDNLKTVFEL